MGGSLPLVDKLSHFQEDRRRERRGEGERERERRGDSGTRDGIESNKRICFHGGLRRKTPAKYTRYEWATIWIYQVQLPGTAALYSCKNATTGYRFPGRQPFRKECWFASKPLQKAKGHNLSFPPRQREVHLSESEVLSGNKLSARRKTPIETSSSHAPRNHAATRHHARR